MHLLRVIPLPPIRKALDTTGGGSGLEWVLIGFSNTFKFFEFVDEEEAECREEVAKIIREGLESIK